MARFIVRNLQDDLRDNLRELARRRGQSMEETVRDILQRTVMRQERPRRGWVRGSPSVSHRLAGAASCPSYG